jgi:Mn-dependent DtxR family transcriptional regulator
VKIQESGENYLETILLLNRKNGFVRSIDVANELGFTKASVSRATGILKEAGYLVMEPDGNLVLTDAGRRRAESVYERHTVIADFLQMTLGVDRSLAVQDSCRIEHIISEESFSRIREYVRRRKERRPACGGRKQEEKP